MLIYRPTVLCLKGRSHLLEGPYNSIKHICSKYYSELALKLPEGIHQGKSLLGQVGKLRFSYAY